MIWISRSTTSLMCSIGLKSGDCGGHLSKVNSLSCSRNQSEMIKALWHGALSCWMGTNCMSTRVFSWHTLGPLVPIEHRLNATAYPSIFVDHVHPFMTTVPMGTDGSMFFTPNSDPTIWMSQQKSRHIRPGNVFQSSIVQFWWACANCSLRFLFLADWSGTRCSLLLL